MTSPHSPPQLCVPFPEVTTRKEQVMFPTVESQWRQRSWFQKVSAWILMKSK